MLDGYEDAWKRTIDGYERLDPRFKRTGMVYRDCRGLRITHPEQFVKVPAPAAWVMPHDDDGQAWPGEDYWRAWAARHEGAMRFIAWLLTLTVGFGIGLLWR